MMIMEYSYPAKGEQIEALINHKAYDFTMNNGGRDSIGEPQYAKVLNVTKKEIKEYLKNNYTILNLPFSYTHSGIKDGAYIIHKPEGYLVYHQERGLPEAQYWEMEEEQVWDYYVDFILRTSGTGLKWS